MTGVFFTVPRYVWCAPLSHPSSCMLGNLHSACRKCVRSIRWAVFTLSDFILIEVCLWCLVMYLEFHDHPRNEIAEKKSNQQKLPCSRRPTSSDRQSAVNQHREFGVIGNCIIGKRPNFFPIKNTSDFLYRSNLTRRACEARAELINRSANRD